jgi:gamma-glutamylcyclotransferase (GGCT)/AIG2-like uncharacterized protein YtfP
MSRICSHLFVYGTLRAGSVHPMAHFLAARARLLGAGSAAGRLYDLGAFPGMLEPVAEGEWVRGEVYEFAEPQVTLAALDRYEGCGEDTPRPWLFERTLTAVALDGGGEVIAWVYYYRGPLEAARQVSSGDYLAGPP